MSVHTNKQALQHTFLSLFVQQAGNCLESVQFFDQVCKVEYFIT